jgi:radical SAM-linked protein
MYEDFLPLVSKPARYIDSEVNVVRKELATVRTKVCLLFPDTYEVGMSHLGLRILYHIINKRQDALCERVFSPWTDYEERLRTAGRPLTSLESNLPIAQFDIVGVTLQYELSATNVLVALDLAGIPRRTRDRNDSHPVIVAGGPCSVNPEPLADFIDVFFIGEAEEAVHELIELRQAHAKRRDFLAALAAREGFYVPSLGSTTVRRRHLRSIEAAPYPDRPLLPLMRPVHDRVTVEVARGCIRGCRFCQAGIIYRPYRERSPERVKELLGRSLACTGYDELSLASLSSGDYSAIQPLIIELMERHRDSRVSVSLPSLRVGTLTPEMVRAIAGTRKTGFTLAPEAGSERLRRVINKPVSDLDLLDAAETIFANGWSVLKLYFMLGLPTETDEDLDGIIRLAHDLLATGKRASKRHVQLNISVSTFVPKPHTPFQWFGQASLLEVRRKQAYLGKGIRRRGVALKFHNPEMSLLEAAFARGDSALGPVLEAAVDRGCRMDGWTECFDFRKWEEAFRSCGLDPAEYAGRTYGPDADLPWDHIRTGVTKEFLKNEYRRALSAEVTGDCRAECTHCGMGCRDGGTPALGVPAVGTSGATAGESPKARPVPPAPGGKEMTSRIRVKYAKTGRLRFLSHLDFMTLMHRTMVRAGVPVAYTQGFNPHPRIAFGPALSVGMESEAEYLDMETDPFIDLPKAVKELNNSLPEGIRVLEARILPKKAPSLSGSITRYSYGIGIPGEHAEDLAARSKEFLSRQTVMVEKDGKQKDIRPGIESIEMSSLDRLMVTLLDSEKVRPRIQDVLMQLFGLSDDQAALFRIRRTAMYMKENGSWKSPMEVK